MQIRYTIFLLLLLIGNLSKGQSVSGHEDYGVFKSFISNFVVSGSVGYGMTFNSHDLTSAGLIQNPGQKPLLFDNTFIVSNPIPLAFTNWVNNVSTVSATPVDASSFLLGLDSAAVKFKAKSHNIPLNLSVHYKFDRYRIGLGFSFEPYFTGEYRPTSFNDNINSFKLDFTSSSHTRWFVLLGGEVLRSSRYTIVVDAKVGSYGLSKKKYNVNQIKKGVFFNLGVRFEYALSEYVKAFLRPSFEFKNYTLTFPESGYSVVHSLPAFYTNVGLSWRLPDRKKCTINSCRTQVHHHHGRKNYRSRVHPFWKWQNPDYGQNYPRLVKYKGKNKKKLNAY